MGNYQCHNNLRHLTGSVAVRLEESRASLEERVAEGPSAGDVYVVAGCPAPVEWVIVEDDPGERFRVAVPGDDQPFVGSGDLRVVLGDGGFLTLRLGIAARLDPPLFDPRLRTGVLAPGSLEAARCQKAANGVRTPSWRERRTDADPAYHDWLAEVAAARAKLEDGPRR